MKRDDSWVLLKDTESCYVITRYEDRILSALIRNGRPVELHVDEEHSADQTAKLDGIYIARVQNIAKNLGAAFVEIAPKQVCYLPLNDLKHPVYTKKGTSRQLQQGDELLVQVVREGIKSKAPAVSTNLTLHGKYALLTTGDSRNSVSSKLGKEERARLLAVLDTFEEGKETLTPAVQKNVEAKSDSRTDQTIGPESRSFGWLLRTNAGEVPEERILDDLKRLRTEYLELMQTMQYRTVFTCLYAPEEGWVRRISDLRSGEAERIVTDDPMLYEKTEAYLRRYQPEDLSRLLKYRSGLQSLAKRFSLEHHLQEALRERVWLKSGGYLVIQPTEALTVIDVNTGKSESGKNREQAFLKLNLEAAREAARQIRLRNLSGIILIDFINMEKQESEKQLLDSLDQELRRDPVRTVLVDMTRLSLVEITRMKKERPLHELGISLQSLNNSPN